MTQYIRYPSIASTPGGITDVNLVEVDGAAISLGQKAMTASFPVVIASDQSPVDVTVGSLPLPTGAATEATLLAFSQKSAGSLVPQNFDEVALTYVPSGPGAGQIATAEYYLSSVLVRTLTMSYDGSDRLSGVVAS